MRNLFDFSFLIHSLLNFTYKVSDLPSQAAVVNTRGVPEKNRCEVRGVSYEQERVKESKAESSSLNE